MPRKPAPQQEAPITLTPQQELIQLKVWAYDAAAQQQAWAERGRAINARIAEIAGQIQLQAAPALRPEQDART